METEITLEANCPNCGGKVNVYVYVDVYHAGNGEVEIAHAEATIGDHRCAVGLDPRDYYNRNLINAV